MESEVLFVELKVLDKNEKKKAKKQYSFLTSEEEAYIVRCYLEDETLTLTELAKEMERCRVTIARVLKRNGVKIREPKYLEVKEREEILRKFYEEKISMSELARCYAVNVSTIHKIVRKNKAYEKSWNVLSQDFREKIVREYMENDVTHADLARRYNYSRSNITHIIADTDISASVCSRKHKTMQERKISPRRRLPITAKELVDEVERTGMPQSELAKKYGLTESCIYHAISR